MTLSEAGRLVQRRHGISTGRKTLRGALNGGVYETGRFADVDPSNVTTRDDVIATVTAMLHDLRRHPDAWENPTLDRFLEALAAVLNDMESAYQLRGETWPTEPTWRLFAEVLVVASGYE